MNDTALQQDTQSDIPCHKSLFATLDERGTPSVCALYRLGAPSPQIDPSVRGLCPRRRAYQQYQGRRARLPSLPVRFR